MVSVKFITDLTACLFTKYASRRAVTQMLYQVNVRQFSKLHQQCILLKDSGTVLGCNKHGSCVMNSTIPPTIDRSAIDDTDYWHCEHDHYNNLLDVSSPSSKAKETSISASPPPHTHHSTSSKVISSFITQASRTPHSMTASFIVFITPQMGTGLSGKSPLLPLSPPLLAAAPPGPPRDVLVYNHQMLFKCGSTRAAASAGFRILFISNNSAPIVLICNPSMAKCLAKYLNKNHDAYFVGYNYPDTLFLAAKEFKKRQRKKADTQPKFTEFFNVVKKLCIKV